MTSPMALIIRMGSVGGYAAKLRGDLLEIGGRVHWWSAEELTADATRAGIAVSQHLIDTSAPTGPLTGGWQTAKAA